jgi:hypothetical protein
MRVAMRVVLGLATFIGVAGLVYLFTSYEWRGSVMLLVLAVAFVYVGLVLRGAFRRASVPATPEAMATEGVTVESEHIGPTIWPFVFSIAAVLLVVGIVGVHWVLIPGGILFAGASAGWFGDIKRQHHPGELRAEHGRSPGAHQGG